MCGWGCTCGREESVCGWVKRDKTKTKRREIGANWMLQLLSPPSPTPFPLLLPLPLPFLYSSLPHPLSHSLHSLPLPPPGGQDSEGSSSSACDLPLLSHHDQEGTEAPASLSARPGQDRGLNKVCRSRFKGQSAAVLHILSILLLQISNCRKTATELHFHSKQVQGKIII